MHESTLEVNEAVQKVINVNLHNAIVINYIDPDGVHHTFIIHQCWTEGKKCHCSFGKTLKKPDQYNRKTPNKLYHNDDTVLLQNIAFYVTMDHRCFVKYANVNGIQIANFELLFSSIYEKIDLVWNDQLGIQKNIDSFHHFDQVLYDQMQCMFRNEFLAQSSAQNMISKKRKLETTSLKSTSPKTAILGKFGL